MNGSPMTLQERYDWLVQEMTSLDPDVRSDIHPRKKRFGSSGELKIHGKMFAFLSKDRLVVKLPDKRMQTLLESARCEHCLMGTRVMKKWVSVCSNSEQDWKQLALEAKLFVASLNS